MLKMDSIRKKKIANANLFGLPIANVVILVREGQINSDSPWMELIKKNRNKLVNVLLNDVYAVSGENHF